MIDLMQLVRKGPDAAIDAPADRVAVTFFGRRYPVEDRPAGEPEPELPPALAGLPAWIEQDLPFYGKSRSAKNRGELYAAFEGTLACVQKVYHENAQFIQNVFKANVERSGLWANDPRKFELMQQRVAEWSRRLPDFGFDRPALLSLELHAKPDFVVRATLDAGIRQALTALVRKLVQSLDCMVALEQVGLIEWVHEDAYRLHFFRAALDTGPGPEVERLNGDADELESRVTPTRQVHEVLCAKNYLLTAATMSLPDRVRTLLDEAPAYLKPAMRVVTGMETRRSVIRRRGAADGRDHVSEEFVYRPDPAVVIGHYALTAWEAAEVDEPPAAANRLPGHAPALLPAKGASR